MLRRVNGSQKPNTNPSAPPPKSLGAKLRNALHIGSPQQIDQGSNVLPLGVPASQTPPQAPVAAQAVNDDVPPPPDEKPPLSGDEILELVSQFDRHLGAGDLWNALQIAANPDFRGGSLKAIRACEEALSRNSYRYRDEIVAVISSGVLGDDAMRIADQLIGTFREEHRFDQELEWLRSGAFGVQTMARASVVWERCMNAEALAKELAQEVEARTKHPDMAGRISYPPYVVRMRNALALLRSGVLGKDETVLRAFFAECERGSAVLMPFIREHKPEAFDLSHPEIKQMLRSYGIGDALLAFDFPRVSELMQLLDSKNKAPV